MIFFRLTFVGEQAPLVLTRNILLGGKQAIQVLKGRGQISLNLVLENLLLGGVVADLPDLRVTLALSRLDIIPLC